jgi:hypothetical protein
VVRRSQRCLQRRSFHGLVYVTVLPCTQAEGASGKHEPERKVDLMPLNWAEVEKRYGAGSRIPTVAGGKTLEITGADASGVHIRNALWRDTLQRRDLEMAVELVEAEQISRCAGAFVEEYRTRVADVRATSVAHVLKDLGVLE